MSDYKNKDRMSPSHPYPHPPPSPPPPPPPRPDEEEEYEEEFEIAITTQKGSSIKVETTSYDKLNDLLDKAFTTYKRLSKEESGEVDEKLQYQ
jgi:hypothetical protein